jgi:hypothetical protein
MKKLIYILLITLTSTLAFTSCTEEEVTPITTTGNGGGAGDEGKL